ncbi:hypothetical protein J6E39_06845 [bacterium]|nr:hypothetical protein [bacterium]
MSVKPVQINQVDRNQYTKNNKQDSKTSFTGLPNPVIPLMDAIDRGGFAASFIAQDGIGMVAPRIHEGLNRNRKETGEYNWQFAQREGVREILSGPSAFLIPMGIMALIKKFSGTANNVHINAINTLGEHFARYASENKNTLSDASKAKSEFYQKIFKNMLRNSTEQKLTDEQLEKYSKHFTEKTLEIEKAKSKGFYKVLTGKKVDGSSQDLKQALADEFMELRKSTVNPSHDFLRATVKGETKDRVLNQNFKTLLDSLKDYTDDAIEKTAKAVSNNSNKDVSEIVKNFNLRRVGTRFASNMSMFGAVVAFYTIIPKLYSLGLKGNPGMKGLEEDNSSSNNNINNKKQDKTAFTGKASLFNKTAEHVNSSKTLKTFSDWFEFNGASMPVSAMLTLLFGFCLPPRYFNAKDKDGNPDIHDRKEILVRDVSSFTAILFAAKALSRGFSDVCAKASGLALNMKPDNHNKSIFHQIKNYVTAGHGVSVLNSEEIISKYSNIDKYSDGINGFFKFIEQNGGNVKKTLSLNKTVKENAEKIVGKKLKDATAEEIKNAFKNNNNATALENIYKVFKDTNNQYVKRAKTMNSLFGFASTIVLVPMFMIWLARYCEKMTKRDVAKEKAEKEQAAFKTAAANPTPARNIVSSAKPTMEGFLKK